MLLPYLIVITFIFTQGKAIHDPSRDNTHCISSSYCFNKWRNKESCFSTHFPKKFSNWQLICSKNFNIFPIDESNKNHPRQVKGFIFSESSPKPLKNAILAAISDNAIVNLLDLNAHDCNLSKNFLDFVGGKDWNNDCQPLAHRYGGHQFGDWAGQLGDGRAHLLGEYLNHMGAVSELQLKGSGITPYSRRGDGRAVIRSSVREFLCSEAMYGLGVPTSRAISLVVSDEKVIRDQFYNGNIKSEKGAVVLRSAPTWLRIGSLEILTAEKEFENLKLMLDHFINTFLSVDSNKMNGISYLYNVPYNSINRKNTNISYVDFFEMVQNFTISTVVDWMSYGFAHGVCNTDNYSLLGITIDYGPFGFVESYDPDFVPNTSDDMGRYSLVNQPSIAMENMDRLLNAISPLLTKTEITACDNILQRFHQIYQSLFMERFRNKLGFEKEHDDDENLIALLLHIMKDTSADFTMTFHQLAQLTSDHLNNPDKILGHMWALDSMKSHKYFGLWIDKYHERINLNSPSFNRQIIMKKHNPRYILRNWMAEVVITHVENGQFAELNTLLNILQNPFEINSKAEELKFADEPPKWARDIKVSCSS